MRNVTFILITLSLQTLLSVIALTGFFAVSREYLRRKQSHLFAYAFGFLCMTLAYGFSFFGQVIGFFQSSALATLLTDSFQPLVAITMSAMSAGFVLAYAPARFRRALLAMLAAVLAAALASQMISPVWWVPSHYGYRTSDLDILAILVHYAPGVLAGVVHLFGYRMRDGKGANAATGTLFGHAGTLILASFCIRFVATTLDIRSLVLVVLVLQIVVAIALGLAAIAKGHEDRAIAVQPAMLVRKNILYKASTFIALLFWALSFFLVFLTSTYFISSTLEALKSGLRKDVHFYCTSFAENGTRLLEHTEMLATFPEIAKLVGSDPAVLPATVNDFVHQGSHTRIVRILDREGVIAYSSFSASEIGTKPVSKVVAKALVGAKVSAAERDDAVQQWTIRAAVPVTFPDATVGGVLLATDLSDQMSFSDFSSLSPIAASGYGYVSANGELAFSVGDHIDDATKDQLRRTLGAGIDTRFTLQGSFDEAFVEHTYTSDDEPNGFFYAILRDQQVNDFALRIMSIIVTMMMLALGIVLCLLVFAASFVLRPIKALREATSRVAQDDYDVHVEYDKPDEVGELARAFNRMSAAIRERTERLRRSVREQQDFLEHSILDLRTPVNVFRWTLELMRFGDTGRMTKQQLEFIEQMHQTNERLSRMLQSLQDVSRLDRGRYTLASEPFAVEDVLDDAAGELAVQVHEKGLAMHWKRPEKPMPFAIADRAATKKAVLKILSNAIKFNLPNGHIEMSLAKSGNHVEVIIEDSGMGIPAQDRDRVFSKFYRSKTVVHDEVEGSGLGLHIAKQLVELQGGTMWFESQVGSGSTFHFTLPTKKKS